MKIESFFVVVLLLRRAFNCVYFGLQPVIHVVTLADCIASGNVGGKQLHPISGCHTHSKKKKTNDDTYTVCAVVIAAADANECEHMARYPCIFSLDTNTKKRQQQREKQHGLRVRGVDYVCVCVRKTRSTLNPCKEEQFEKFALSNLHCSSMERMLKESQGWKKRRNVFIIKKNTNDIKEACNLDKNMPLTAVIVKCCSETHLKYLCVFVH